MQMRGLNFRQCCFQRQTRFWQRGVEIFYAVMTHRDHNYAGEPFFFQAKFCIHDRRIEAFEEAEQTRAANAAE